MQLVVADTGPINYLLLIGHIQILPALFGKVILPSVVRDEMLNPKAPLLVREWMANPPSWLESRPVSAGAIGDPALNRLDAGEIAAILLATELHADLILMDDREGVAAARGKGFKVAGTLGILSMASRQGLLDLAEAFAHLQLTNFHCRREILDSYLANKCSE